jgi:transcriptional regulator with XRE-family HTH domain
VTIGEWIKDQLEQRGLSMRAFANQVGVSQPTVSKWIAGKIRPDAASAAKIAVALQVPLHEVYEHAGLDDPLLAQARALRRELNDFVAERDDLEQALLTTQRRRDELSRLIEDRQEQIARIEEQRHTGVDFGTSPEEVRRFIAEVGSDPIRLSRLPEDVRIAYTAGFEQGREFVRPLETQAQLNEKLDQPLNPQVRDEVVDRLRTVLQGDADLRRAAASLSAEASGRSRPTDSSMMVHPPGHRLVAHPSGIRDASAEPQGEREMELLMKGIEIGREMQSAKQSPPDRSGR